MTAPTTPSILAMDNGTTDPYWKPISDIDNAVNALLLRAYPIGSVYLSMNSTDPGTLFGGQWLPLPNDYYLFTASADMGNVGGSSTSGSTALTVAQMPAHNHTVNVPANAGTGALGVGYGTVVANPRYPSAANNPTSGEFTGWGTQTSGEGAGHTHSIDPPKIKIMAWRRIA